MQIILQGNAPVLLPRQYQMKDVTFSIYIHAIPGMEPERCTILFYHSQKLFLPVERIYVVDKTQPIKNLFFDTNEKDFNLRADMCRVVLPVLSDNDEVVMIPLF